MLCIGPKHPIKKKITRKPGACFVPRTKEVQRKNKHIPAKTYNIIYKLIILFVYINKLIGLYSMMRVTYTENKSKLLGRIPTR